MIKTDQNSKFSKSKWNNKMFNTKVNFKTTKPAKLLRKKQNISAKNIFTLNLVVFTDI